MKNPFCHVPDDGDNVLEVYSARALKQSEWFEDGSHHFSGWRHAREKISEGISYQTNIVQICVSSKQPPNLGRKRSKKM